MNVKSFGVMGDGTTDDTAAIAAVLALSGDVIYFPNGEYKVTAQLTIAASGVCMMGAGKASKIFGVGSPFTVVRLSGDNIELSRLWIVHSGETSGTVGELSVIASNGDENVVRDVVVDGAPHNGSGIRIDSANRNSVLFNIVQNGGTNSNDISLETFGDDCIIFGNRCLSPNKQNGISIGSVTGPATMRRARIMNNHVKGAVNATTAGVAHGIVAISEQTPTGDMSDVIITGNVVEDTEGHGIYVADGAARVIIAGNIINNCLTAPSGSLLDAIISVGSTVAANAPHYSVIRDNIVRGGGHSGKHGIRLQNTTGAVVQGNTISETANSIGIRVVGDDVTIAQNVVSDTTSSAIWRESGSNGLIQGNICQHVQSGIELGGTGDLVTSNRLVGMAAGTGLTIGGVSNYIRDNIISDFSVVVNAAGAVNCVIL